MNIERYLPALAGWIVVGVGLMGPMTAHAEAGDGLRAGDLELTPRLTLSGTYDQNVFRLSESERDGGIGAGAPVLSVEPGLSIATLDATMVDFTFDGSVEWEQYLAQQEHLRDQSGLQGAGSVGATINPQGGLSLRLTDSLTYRNEPPPYPSSTSWNRLVNSTGAQIGIHPGDRILNIELGYDFVLYRYFTEQLRDLNKHEHEFGTDLTWKFLPKTALVVDGDAKIIRYQESSRGFQEGHFPNVNSTPIHLRAGLSGLITNRISLRLLGGYAWGLYNSGPSYSGLIARTDVSFNYGSLALDNNLTLGYERSFSDASVGNFFGYHRGFLEVRQNFLQKRLGLSLGGEFTHRNYADIQVGTDEDLDLNQTQGQDGTDFYFDELEDNYLTASAGVHGRFLDWWTATLEYSFQANLTSDQIDALPETGDITYLRRFQRHLVMLSTTIKY